MNVVSSPSDSASGVDSDGDVSHERVHPAAEPAPLYGFACAFSRSRCGHDELFHPHYTRTNLRKGDKILRCFPHCCPDHVTRSFCGASLFLDVHWAKPQRPVEPDVVVFAKFRVHDARGPAPGDRVTLAEIAASLQSESNPHGEWIPATRVSAVGDARASDYVFEINREARWYYHWESGVAKRHRLKHHVLDVVVLSPSFSSSSSALTGDHRPLEVVAATRSPPFRLISFRRATPRAVQALSVSRVQRDHKVASRASGKIQYKTSPQRTRWEGKGGDEEATAGKASPPYPTDRLFVRPLPSPPLRQHYPPMARPPPWSSSPAAMAPPLARPASRPSIADLAMSIDRLGTAAQPPRGREPAAATASAALRLLRLRQCLDRVAATEAVAFMDTFQRVYADAVARASGLQLPTGPTADAVQRLLTDARVAAAPQPPSLSRDATAILCELLLWLSFDVELHRAVHAAVARDAASLLSRPQLEAAFGGLVEWLERHVDAFLRDRGWQLEDVLRAVDPRGSSATPQDAYATGLRACVAMLRELTATQAKAAAARRRGGVAPPERPLRGVAPSRWAMNGLWQCDLLQGGLSVAAAAATDLSVLSLFALLRELGAVSVRLDDARALDVVSLLNASGRHDTGARLTLDGASHWCRHFPSGVATAALAPGGLQWGDHTGEVDAASQVVHCNLYAWAGAAQSLGRCVQLQLWTPAPDALLVRVAVSRAVPDTRAAPSLDAAVQQLHVGSLQQKLRLVRAWEPVVQAELRYARMARP